MTILEVHAASVFRVK